MSWRRQGLRKRRRPRESRQDVLRELARMGEFGALHEDVEFETDEDERRDEIEDAVIERYTLRKAG